MTKSEQKNEYLKLSLKDFLIKMESLLSANVEVYNAYSGTKEKVVSACSKNLTYTLSNTGEKELSHKKWDEVDYMRFRNSFKYRDGFTV